MAACSQYLESQVLTQIFRSSTFAKPTVLAFALATQTLSATCTGSLIGQEVLGQGYARVALNPGDANWGSPGTTGITTNVTALVYATATANWGTVTSVAICDNATAGSGNCLFWANLLSAKVVNTGDVFVFSAGSLSIQMT
jgi:hypothetical protein